MFEVYDPDQVLLTPTILEVSFMVFDTTTSLLSPL